MRCGWGRVGIGISLCIRLVRVGCCWRLLEMLRELASREGGE